MREAHAAAKAEVESSKTNAGPSQRKSKKSNKSGGKGSQKDRPIKVDAKRLKESQDAKKVEAETPVEVQSIDLSPEMAKKLRTLRRLYPGRSDAELLARIEAEKSVPASAKEKKSWFSFS